MGAAMSVGAHAVNTLCGRQKCKKCGVRRDYYSSNKHESRNSCREHGLCDNNGICVICHRRPTHSNCYHVWS